MHQSCGSIPGRRLGLALIVVAGVSLHATPAAAVPMEFKVAGAFYTSLQASVTFVYDSTSGKIDITLANTTTLSPDWRITGFAFNLPTAITGSTALTGPTGFRKVYDKDDINTPGQYGFFDLAALTGTDFEFGNVNNGVRKGQSALFSFQLSGAFGNLDEAKFLSQLSTGEWQKRNTYFAVRFQQVGGGILGKDMGIPVGSPTAVKGTPPPTGSQPTNPPKGPSGPKSIPEPTVLALLGAAVASAAIRQRRGRSRG
jgi:hypothetical protein